jgi:hypothetical protein
MKSRHAAALALVGWYLLMPPLKNKSVATDAPLSTWKLVNSFDTASDCENSRSSLIEQAKKTASQENKDFEATRGDGSNSQNLETLQQLYFLEVVVPLQKCIATDDPRLKTN